MGVTHHSNYIRWMEEARVDLLSFIGLDYGKLEKLGIISAVTSAECRYLAPTTFSDVVSVFVRAEEFRGVRFYFTYTMKRADGKTVAEGRTEHCFLNSSGRPIRLQKDFPEIYEMLLSHTENEQ